MATKRCASMRKVAWINASRVFISTLKRNLADPRTDVRAETVEIRVMAGDKPPIAP